MAEHENPENSSQDEVESAIESRDLVASAEQDSDDGLAEILEALPPEKRAEIMRVVESKESHSGWLPTPDFLQRYEQILPGLAERIVALPEREQAHRHRIVEQVVKDDRDLKQRGQTFAMVSLVLLLLVSIILIGVGQYAWAARVAIFGIAGVVGIFVTGKWADVKAGQKLEAEDEV